MTVTMSTYSKFQTLPMPIVHMVTEYMEGRRRGHFSLDINEHSKLKAVLVPLLSVSERWRTSALGSICDNCTLDFDYSRKAIEVTFPAWPTDFLPRRIRKIHYVKKVCVVAKGWKELCDGTFNDVINRPQFEHLSFPRAKTLEIRLDLGAEDHRQQSYSYLLYDHAQVHAIYRKNLIQTVISILKLVPAVDSVAVELGSNANRASKFMDLFDALATNLRQGGVYSVSVSSIIANSVAIVNLQGVQGLTSIALGPNVACAPIAKAAYLNAPTLKQLGIRISNEADWCALVFGGTNVPAVYSCLELLSVTFISLEHGTMWSAIEDAEPFPSLRKLVVQDGYPFTDDLLYRGSGKSLQRLRIPFSALSTDVLDRLGVLQREGVKQMCRIHIGNVTSRDEASLTAANRLPMKRTVHRMLEIAATLRLPDDTSDWQLFSAVSSAPITSTIQHLDFAHLPVDASSIIRLVSRIQSLVSLNCVVVELWTGSTAPVASERPDILHARYHPLSTNFRMLRVPDTSNATAENIAYSAMLLAILCPSFKVVDLAPKLRRDFGREIAWAMVNVPFAKYADRLRPLIYKDLNY